MRKKILLTLVSLVCFYLLSCYYENQRVNQHVNNSKILFAKLDSVDVNHKYATTIYVLIRLNLISIEDVKTNRLFGWIYHKKLLASPKLEAKLEGLENWKKEFDLQWHQGRDL